jgi:hypothetical protein
MGRIILGIIAAIIVIMLALWVVHVVVFYGMLIAVLALVAFFVFRIGRWAGRRNNRERDF